MRKAEIRILLDLDEIKGSFPLDDHLDLLHFIVDQVGFAIRGGDTAGEVFYIGTKVADFDSVALESVPGLAMTIDRPITNFQEEINRKVARP